MVPRIFNQQRRLAKYARAESVFAKTGETPWMYAHIVDDLDDRLDFVSRSFSKALLIGDLGGLLENRLNGLTIDHCPLAGLATDLVDVPLDSYDLILAPSLLDTANDLPGMLIQIKKALLPGGLFMGAFMAAGSLSALRTATADLMAEEQLLGVPRFHPQIDVRGAGDLLARAGFTFPVADVECLSKPYASLDDVLLDLRGHGLGNCLTATEYMRRSDAIAFRQHLAGKSWHETFEILTMTGWAPQTGDPVQVGPKRFV